MHKHHAIKTYGCMEEWKYRSPRPNFGIRWKRVVSFTACSPTPSERYPPPSHGTQWMRGWVGSEENNLYPSRESNPVRPTGSQLYWDILAHLVWEGRMSENKLGGAQPSRKNAFTSRQTLTLCLFIIPLHSIRRIYRHAVTGCTFKINTCLQIFFAGKIHESGYL